MLMITDSATFRKEVLESQIPVAVDFYADWCPPCRMYSPIFEKVAAKFGEKAKFVKLNVDSAIEVAKEYNVMSIPSTMLFKGGKPAGNMTGAFAEEDLENWIKGRI